jgi:3-deoxy-D-manno-octulosonic-acid transferase
MNFNLNKINYLLGYFIYTLSTKFYFLIVRSISPFNTRARDLWKGQKQSLAKILEVAKDNAKPSIWFHVSSLGEFEQGKPVLEALKRKYPSYKLIVTFFSPSGYNARRKNDITDEVYYLPFESAKTAQQIVTAFNPTLAVFVKYDLWYHYLKTLRENNIPTLLISALFRPRQRYFKPNAPFQRSLLEQFTFIFCQNQSSAELLNSINYSKHLVSGDTRFDRVTQNLNQAIPVQIIDQFKKDNFLLLIGSSYHIEEQMLAEASIGSNRKIIIAPHFTNNQRIEEIVNRFEPNAVSLQDFLETPDAHEHKKVLVIDRIGWLANLYQYADLAFIGGGFKENGLHNILEPASFGMPICFGPKINRFPEAKEMVSLKLASTIENAQQLSDWIEFYENNEVDRATQSLKCRQWIQSKTGATQMILNWIQIHIKLT